MPRTASLSRNIAESLIGSAENLIVNSANRPLLRKWATACGYPATEAYKFSNVELANLYHINGPKGSDFTPAAQTMPIRANVPVPGEATMTAAEAMEAAFRLIASSMAPQATVLDETRVREIAAEEAGKIEPKATVTRLEVTGPQGTHHIEGIVHNATAKIIKIASLGHPVMLVGPAGSGKTTIGEHVATALGLPFYITSTVFDTHELLGFVDGYGNYHSTPFRKAFETGGFGLPTKSTLGMLPRCSP